MTHQLAFALPTAAGLGKILVFLVMLSVLVVLHEYGHFIVARRNGVRVNDFALGMGPTLLKWTSPRSGTNYRLNLFPIGGYCAMQGEDGQSSEAEQQRQFREKATEPQRQSNPVQTYGADNFQAKTPLQRLAVVVAGPIMNFIVALVLLLGSYGIFGIPQPTTFVGDVIPGKPAAQAGLRKGDRIVTVNGAAVADGSDLVKRIQTSLGKPLALMVDRNQRGVPINVTPIGGPDGAGHTVGVIGFTKVFRPQRMALPDAFAQSVQEFGVVTASTFGALGGLVTHPRATAGQLHGVVGMASVAGEVQDAGWGPYLNFAALISISLGIFNLLPIPALDGGRGIFILVEMLRGKPVDPEKEALVHVGGFAVIIALMLFVSYHDIASIVSGKGVF